jgi:hypothetical protein
MTPEVTKISANKPTRSSWIWEFFKVSFPVITALVTTGLTLLVWFTQQKIEQKVNDNQMLLEAQLQTQQTQLQAQLALKEEFYKRRLTIYENACRQIADAQTSLADVGTTDKSVIRATNMVNNLDKLRRGNQLYWSKQVDMHLDKLWNLGICRVGSRVCELPEGKVLEVEALPQEITNAVVVLHEQMKTDLNVLELAKALQEARQASQETK